MAATIRVKNPNLGGEKWITIPTKILSEADHIVTNKGQGDLYLSNDGTYKDVIKSANDYTDKLIELITGSSPDILETLKELSNQTSDNKDFINVLNKSIATKLDKTANAVSASKLATPIKLWGNDFDGSQSVYGNLCAPNGNLGLGINTNNVVLGNNTNPSYIYGSSVMFKTGTDAVAAYISYDGKVGIGTANPENALDVIGTSYFYTHLYCPVVIKSSKNTVGIKFISSDANDGLYLLANNKNFYITDDGWTTAHKIWHEGNLNPFALSGNTLKLGKSTNLNLSYAELVSVASESSDNGVALRYWKTRDYLGSYSGIQIDSRGIWYDKTGGTLYKIWNEDNDGPGSGLDADTLDGLLAWLFLRIIDPIDDVNNTNLYKLYSFITDLNSRCLNVPLGFSSGEMIYIAGYDTGFMLVSSYTKDELIYRRGTNSLSTNTIINNDWKTIAFTDSTVANATKAYALLSNAASGNVDANKIVTANCYMLYTSYMGNESTNVPVANAYLNGLLSFGLHPNGTTAQLYISKDNPLYYRSSVTNDWKELTTSDGYYKDMRVGLADDLGDMEEKVEEEYIIQPTANTNEIRDGYAHIDSLKGNSVVWNLLVSSNKIFVNSSNATTIVNKTDNSFTATSIAGNDEKSVVIGPVFKDYNIYLITFEYISNLSYKLQHTCGFDNIEPASTFTRHVHIQKRSDPVYSRLYFYNYTTTTEEWNLEVKDLIIVDLTKMFGAGNEPTTLEEFEARRPKNVSNAYNEGEIINLTADSIKSIGFNQWDEEYEIGGISSTGVLANYNDRIRPKNYIPCVPNASYFAKGYFRHGIFFYNENKKWIENKQVYGDDFQFFTPSNAVYMLWNSSSGYFKEGSYCINLYNESSNGTYEPYKEFVRQLPTNLFEGGMKSAGDVYDEIYWDKNKKKYIKVTRVGSVDLGSLDWYFSATGLHSSNGILEKCKVNPDRNASNIICPKYTTTDPNITGPSGNSPTPNHEIALGGGGIIYIHDTNYTDSNAFKQAMHGVILNYELAEPIVEELDIPYMDYEVSNDGTERIESSTPSTPIKASVTYNFDAVNTIKLNRFDISDIKKKGATKLAKSIKLWGNNFDGTQDLDHNIYLVNNSLIHIRDNQNLSTNILTYNSNNLLSIGYGSSAKGHYTDICGHTITFRTNTSHDNSMFINSNGNVGIGITNPQYKLDVDGSITNKNTIYCYESNTSTRLTLNIKDNVGRIYTVSDNGTTFSKMYIGKNTADTIVIDDNYVGIGTADPLFKLDVVGTIHTSDKIILENNKGIAAKDTLGSNCDLISLNGYDLFNIGYGVAGNGHKTALDGESIYFRYGTSHTNGMILNSSGNITIGSSDAATDRYKLHVLGKVYLNEYGAMGNQPGPYLHINKSGNPFAIGTTSGHIDAISFGYASDNSWINETITISNAGNCVGINNNNPKYALDVNGVIYSNDGISLPNNKYYQLKDINGTSCGILSISEANQLIFGYGTAARGYDTYLLGNSLLFKVNTTNLTSMVINPSGNVTIGGSDLASTHDKLYVDGKVTTRELYVSRNIVTGLGRDGLMISDNQVNVHNNLYNKVATVFDCDLNGNAYFKHTIGGGDLVDWYGVSWSEDSSDPTCTRIGNMALHRSLPILNAMRGYLITIASLYGEIISPLSDNWSELTMSIHPNDRNNINYYGNAANTMVKIPEFWYIDDYEPSTKTHNLKISQTAKAGWCHHKEAYVGAYEGWSDGTYYLSRKYKIPTVSVSRTALRPLVRTNGYEGEYKWNIYTYEEHRAICHLFLVEYATRNSQAPVNTALTTDGFKQGGLGSGCATGSVKINGVDTYSFIPTGTTDSLGNGSGQVAYTVTLTDADGNEIGTVTRYANRYRGIENPFGHIWKYVDDIVNVYNAETTYKTVYKCNKPEHFATYKNAKYKPLCSFPGGLKMQGWSKEIKATINCDFFKYSVGGSASTYWCDYNYDSDDTSEHCLLIGGNSGNGGLAGLFGFYLDSGVGDSYVNIGSRLTYLPWAE